MIACVAVTAPVPNRATARAGRATDDALFEQAIEASRVALDVQARVRAPHERVPMVIVRKPHGAYAVYSTDSWTEPQQRRSRRWRPPTGDPVATVALDGAVRRA